jgi:signal transduction histidine kinase
VVLAVLLARRYLPGLNVCNVEGIARFFCISMIASLVAAGAAAVAGILWPIYQSESVILRWWSTHAMGMALIGVFGLSLSKGNIANLLRPLRMIEGLALVAMVVAACFVIFGQWQLPYSFMLMPLICLAAVRFRVVGTALILIMITIMSMAGTMLGMGPYRLFDPDFAPLVVHLLILFGYAPLLLVAALLEERDRLHVLARRGKERAELASAAKSRLLANVAHEIKSPVSGIIGIGELWAAGQLGNVSPAQLEMAEMLVKTARQTEALAHDLLDVARAESGAIRVDLRPTDVTGVMEDVRRTMLLRSETAKVPVDLVIEGDALVAMADSHRLAQVVGNLVINAIKYAGEGGPIKLAAHRHSGCVRIEVRDKGPGLSPEKQAQLFEPFNRLGLERSSIEGHGIGLALAKRLTELQGGEIGVISSEGAGATFWIELKPA